MIPEVGGRSECFVSLSVLGEERVLLCGISRNEDDHITVPVDGTQQWLSPATEFFIEPRTRILNAFLRLYPFPLGFCGLKPSFPTLLPMNEGSPTQSSMMAFAVSFRGLRSADMLIFSPFRYLYTPCEAIVCVVPRWTTQAGVDGEIRSLSFWEDVTLSGVTRSVVDIPVQVSRDQTAAPVAGHVLWHEDTMINGHMVRVSTAVESLAQTIRDMLVTIEAHGSVLDTDITLIPTTNERLPLSGQAVGDPAGIISSRVRGVCIVECEVVLEVTL